MEKDGKENVLPEYFVHFSQVEGRRLKENQMVQFTPNADEKGLSALNVSVIDYTTEFDPCAYIAQRIYDEFDLEIPCMAWLSISTESIREVYNYLRAERDKDTAEMECITKEYGLEEVPKNEHILCIEAGGYDLWDYEKEQMKKEGYPED